MKQLVRKSGLWFTALAVFAVLLAAPLTVAGQFNDGEMDWNEDDAAAYYTYTVTYNTATITAVDPSLIGNITVPSFLGGFPVVAIGDSAFSGCSAVTAVTVPEGITSLGLAAFSGCMALESVVLPESMTTIPVAAFSGCSALREITLPAALTTVSLTAFTGCSALTDVYYGGLEADRAAITIQAPNTELLNAVWHYDVTPATPESHLYYTYTTEDGKATIITVDKKIAGNVTVPTLLGGCPVVTIEDEAFAYCTALTGLVLPAGVTAIGDAAFTGCTALQSVVLPSGLTTLGEWVFSDCYALTAIRLPDALSVVPDWTFDHCSALASVALGDRVTNIGIGAFRDCKALTAITLPQTVATVEDWAFSDCAALEQVSGGAGLKVVGDGAFQRCAALTAIAFPDGVTAIGTAALAECTALEQVTLPSSLDAISEQLLYDCRSLTDLTLPVGITTIGAEALRGCTALTTLTLPVTLVEIEETATVGCDNLTDVYYAGTEVQKKAILIGADNNPLRTAVWHYAATPDTPEQTEAPLFAVDSTTAPVGRTVTLAVRVQNNPGIATATLKVNYDAALLTFTAADGKDFGDVEILSADATSVTLLWVGESGNVTKDGVLANLTFTVPEEAPVDAVAAVAVSYLPEDVYNTAWENITFDTLPGAVTIVPAPAHIPGDINGDGEFALSDITTLQRYYSGWDVVVNEPALDVNGDGEFGLSDITTLQRYYSGWDVEIH